MGKISLVNILFHDLINLLYRRLTLKRFKGNFFFIFMITLYIYREREREKSEMY